jgi:hypothetical protein
MHAFTRGGLRFAQEIVVVLLAVLSSGAAAQNAPLVDVGLVVPRDAITNETISATMVTDPRDFEGIAALEVVPIQVPAIPGVNTYDLLGHYKVQVGENPNFVPAGSAFVFTATDGLQLRFKRSDIANGPMITTRASLRLTGASPNSLHDDGFRSPPITMAGALHLIHGPLSGASSQTQVRVNGTAAKILAESPREVFCFVPPTMPVGPAEWTVQEGDRRTRLKTWVLGLQMSADKLKLMKGESTAFHVFIRGVETIPKEAWSGSGSVPELVNPALIRKFLPDFTPPSPLQPGVLVLALENLSTGTVVMSGGDKLALTFSYGQPKYEYHGTITASKAGSFNIDGTLIPFLHDEPGLPDRR